MNILLTICAAFIILGSCKADDWRHLHLKFDLLWNGYFSIPLTLEELLQDRKWQLMTCDKDLNVDFYSYGQDPRVSIGFDAHGNIAALRACFIIDHLNNRAKKNGLEYPYTFDDKPMYSRGTFWDNEVYYTTVLFSCPETLLAGGRNNTNGLLAEDLYVKINGEYTMMPRREADAPSLGFTKQSCFIGMGRHYMIDMSPSTDCNDLQQVFLLYDDEDLVGMGIAPFGSFTTSERSWFEDPSSLALKMIVSHRPSCFMDWVDKYGLTSLHIFFKKHPRLTFCS